MTRVGIIADDLTSAADGAGPFSAAGLDARVVLGTGTVPVKARVVSIDTNSRAMRETEAASATAGAVRAVGNAPILYKTVDSTLRGHLAAEIVAALDASGRRTAVVAPAFPAEGRTTQRATQYVDGVAVSQSSFANDPTHPVREANLLRLLAGARRWRPGEPLPGGIVVADATTDADLDAVVKGVGYQSVLWVGSPGVAAALARRITPPAATARELLQARRVLAVVGSRHPISRAQADALVRASHVVDAGAARDAVSELREQLHRHGVAALTDRSMASTPEQTQQRLAGIVYTLVEARDTDALLAAGGATARALLDALDVRVLDLVGEPEPGVVALRTKGLIVVVKAGGFGDPGTLIRLHQRLAVTKSEEE